MVHLLKKYKVPIGNRCDNRGTAKRMTLSMSDTMHKLLIAKLQRDDDTPIAFITDGSTDKRNNHFQVCLLQTLEDNKGKCHLLFCFFETYQCFGEIVTKVYFFQ